MNREDMDRLFREKSDQFEVKPGASAWEAINGQITTKASIFPIVWKVAAMLIVLLSAVLYIFKWQGSPNSGSEIIASHPVPAIENHEWVLPKESLASVEQTNVLNETVKAEPVVEKSGDQTINIDLKIDARSVLVIERLDVVLEFPELQRPGLSLEQPQRSSVKIRYYASNTESEKNKKSFGQFLAKAQAKLSPDVLLADIRTAKDDLFRGNKGD